MRKPQKPLSYQTLLAQAMGRIDPVTKAVTPPLHLSTTYLFDGDNGYASGFAYGRPDNATVREAEAVLKMLENGEEALLFSSGMAAATAVFMACDPGDHIVAPVGMYWALRGWLRTEARRWGLETSFADTSSPDAVKEAIRPGKTRLIWVETPSNPMLAIADIAAIADLAHNEGARLAVDSTLASPIHTRPLDFGADIVMHSASKILNGHTDVIAGALVTKEKDAVWERIEQHRKLQGAILGPFEAFLLMRGMRTLGLRAKAQAASAAILAQRLVTNRCISAVFYPGMPNHPGHDIAAKQMTDGFGHVLSVRLVGGPVHATASAATVSLWKRATSLGGVESLIEHRASVEGPDSPCPADLLRLSVGIEDVEDLFTDLDKAMRSGCPMISCMS